MKRILVVLGCAAALQAREVAASARNLTISDARVSEGGQATFIVSLSAPGGLTGPVTVQWATQDLTASAASDYQAVSGTLVFDAPGSAEVQVAAMADQELGEGSEVFLVRLSASTNASIADGLGYGVIADGGDGAPDVPAKCDLDGDGRSNLLVFHGPDGEEHRPMHQDWGLAGPLASLGLKSVESGETTAPGKWEPVAMDDFGGNGSCDLFWVQGDRVALTVTGTDGQLLAPHPEHVLTMPHPGPGWRLVGSGPFNGDSLADLLWWNSSTRSLRVWSWDFESWPPAVSVHDLQLWGNEPVGEPLAVFDPQAGPYTGILWREPLGGLIYWRMNGLEWAQTSPIPDPPSAMINMLWRVAAVGDFDGDGREDLVWQESDGPLPGSVGRAALWLMRGTSQVKEALLSPAILNLTNHKDGIIEGPR